MLNKKRLNYCKAYIYYDGETIAESTHVALVSYNTLICVWKSIGRILFVGEHYKHSNTTVQHFYKFLKQLQCGISGYDVSRWFNECFNGYTGEIIDNDKYRFFYGHNSLIYASFYNDIFRLNGFSAYELENAINNHELG